MHLKPWVCFSFLFCCTASCDLLIAWWDTLKAFALGRFGLIKMNCGATALFVWFIWISVNAAFWTLVRNKQVYRDPSFPGVSVHFQKQVVMSQRCDPKKDKMLTCIPGSYHHKSNVAHYGQYRHWYCRLPTADLHIQQAYLTQHTAALDVR